MRLKREQWERLAAVGTIMILLLAWLFGGMRQDASTVQKLMQATPDGMVFIASKDNLWAAKPSDQDSTTNWLSIGKATGYGGPLEIVTATDTRGAISGIAVTASAETASYLQQVIGSGLVDAYVNQSVNALNHSDAITGATLTSQALQSAITSSALHTGREASGWIYRRQ